MGAGRLPRGQIHAKGEGAIEASGTQPLTRRPVDSGGELSTPHLRREIGGLGRAGGPKVPEASGVFPCRVGGGFHHVASPFFFFFRSIFFFQVDFI